MAKERGRGRAKREREKKEKEKGTLSRTATDPLLFSSTVQTHRPYRILYSSSRLPILQSTLKKRAHSPGRAAGNDRLVEGKVPRLGHGVSVYKRAYVCVCLCVRVCVKRLQGAAQRLSQQRTSRMGGGITDPKNSPRATLSLIFHSLLFNSGL